MSDDRDVSRETPDPQPKPKRGPGQRVTEVNPLGGGKRGPVQQPKPKDADE